MMKSGQRAKKPQPGMKRLTCYYWRTRGWCEHEEENCLYAHRDTGINAEEPKGRKSGVPSVAGKNARRSNPVRVDWRKKHGLPSPNESGFPEFGPSQRQAIGTHARGNPSQKFVLAETGQLKTAARKKPLRALPLGPEGSDEASVTINPEAKLPTCSHALTCEQTTSETQPSEYSSSETQPSEQRSSKSSEENKPKTAPVTSKTIEFCAPKQPKPSPVKSTGGLLMIANMLRESVSTASTSTISSIQSEPADLSDEQYTDLRRRISQIAVRPAQHIVGGKRPLDISKEMEEWFRQRSKYAVQLRRYVDRCWDPEMELPNVFKRLHLAFPSDGRLPQPIVKLCQEREMTAKALRSYLGWIRLYTEDIFEMRRAGRAEAQHYAAWGLSLMDHYLNIACPRLSATLVMIENNLAARAVEYGFGAKKF